LWIEKPHSASTFQFQDLSIKNVLFLDSDFDVNVLYPFVSAVMSDYSSAVFDAVYRHIPVIMYTPDLEQFKGGNIGLTFDIETNCISVLARTIPETICMLEEIASSTYFEKLGRIAFYERYLGEFWNNTKGTYDQIWNDIRKKAKL
jgi:CDP-glycerol glycerophosphotransferase (TagB/SpsB family)